MVNGRNNGENGKEVEKREKNGVEGLGGRQWETERGRMMSERERGGNLKRFYSLKGRAQQGEVALIRALH